MLFACLGGPALKRLFLLFLIVSSTYGCLIFPLSSDHGGEIDEAQKRIVVGSSTREEVIAILGEPDVSKDRFILYVKRESYGGVGVVIWSPSGSYAGPHGQEYMDLYFEFDNYGVLVDFNSKKYDRGLDYVE
jgi:outer membrane protein assembly factor BamE (lipoprotein component of BamABCDE complex)